MGILFEPMQIKGVAVPNRFVRSATYDGSSDMTGQVTERQLTIFEDLAKGGIGLIISGIASVQPDGRVSPFQNAIDHDDHIPGLKRLTDRVHQHGAKIAVQLFHAGREAVTFLRSQNKQAHGPSAGESDAYFKDEYRAMTEDEIAAVIGAFGDAAKRAREAGFDAVQVHGAHAYLLSQFLSPYTNRRTDAWGGTLEKRLRLHAEIYKDIRAKVGEGYPVLIKIGVQDGFSEGLALAEGKEAARLLADCGYDALEISSGLRGQGYETAEYRTRVKTVDKEAYFRRWCKDIKAHVDVPVMMVGGLRTFELMEEVIHNREADFVSLCRPFIREPDLVKRWKSGDRHRATCISCNKCLEALFRAEKFRCVQLDKASRQR